VTSIRREVDMSVLDIIRKRYSVRGYTDRPVEEEKLMMLMEAVRWAPSACNIQPCTCIIVREPGPRQALNASYERNWFSTAPVVIVVCVDRNAAWRRKDGTPYDTVDAAIVMDHIILTATELGLGTCWIGAFDTAVVKQVLGLPEHVDPVVMTPVGYPAKARAELTRKSTEELVRWDRYE